MAYITQNFKPEQVLSAEQLNHIEAGIVAIEKVVEELKKYGSDVKRRLAAVITDKGIETASSDDIDVMIANIANIQTGISLTQVVGTTILSSDLVDIKTFVTHETYTE